MSGPSNQNKMQPGMVWPVFVEMATDDGVVTIGAHNVIWIKAHRSLPESLTAIKTRGTDGSITIVGLPVDEVRAAFRVVLATSRKGFAADVASALLAEKGVA
jgi:hypothetical protein